MNRMSYRNLTLAFFTPAAHDHWINRLVARASQHPYCHLELFFETTNQCFSIQWGEKVSLKTKTLASPCYEIVTLLVSMQEYDGCLDFCRKANNLGIIFDDYGMWKSYFLPDFFSGSDSCTLKRTFCSKIICEALQYAGVHEVKHRLPSMSTPSRLYNDIVHSKRRVCASVPYKREDMVKKKVICFQNKMYMRVSDHI